MRGFQHRPHCWPEGAETIQRDTLGETVSSETSGSTGQREIGQFPEGSVGSGEGFSLLRRVWWFAEKKPPESGKHGPWGSAGAGRRAAGGKGGDGTGSPLRAEQPAAVA